MEPTEEPMKKQMETTEASLKIGEFTKDGKKYLGITIVTFDRGFVKDGYGYGDDEWKNKKRWIN